MAIDRQRKGTAKSHILKDPAPNVVGIVHVRKQRDPGSLRALPQQHLESMSGFRFLQEGIVLELDSGALDVAVARSGLGGYEVGRADIQDETVDVRQLPAIAV